jgi:hypothetical protein
MLRQLREDFTYTINYDRSSEAHYPMVLFESKADDGVFRSGRLTLQLAALRIGQVSSMILRDINVEVKILSADRRCNRASLTQAMVTPCQFHYDDWDAGQHQPKASLKAPLSMLTMPWSLLWRSWVSEIVHAQFFSRVMWTLTSKLILLCHC